MPVFVSYDFADQAKVDDLIEALNGNDIETFLQRDRTVGSNLSETLRNELEICSTVVFVATHNSIESNWCHAELGAAWGLKKRIAVWLSDSDLESKDLPPHLRADLWERSLFKLAKSLESTVREEPESIQDFSAESIEATIRRVVSHELRQAREWNNTLQVLSDLRYCLDSPNWQYSEIRQLMMLLIGQPVTDMASRSKTGWRFGFTTQTTTGEWSGCALEESIEANDSLVIYNNCLIWHTNKYGKIDGVVATKKILEELHLGMLGLGPWSDDVEKSLIVGSVKPGTALSSRTRELFNK